MATDLERMVVSLEANISKYEKSLAKAMGQTNTTAKGIEDRFNRMNPNFDSFGNSFSRGLLGAVGSALALEQSIVRIRQAVADVDDLGDLAERVGMSTDAIQALRFTMGQAGGDAAMADKAFDKFSDTVAEAALGTGYLMKVFNANGIALRDSSGKLRENEELLVEFAKLVTNAGSAQEKLKVATDAFGRQAGPKMVGTLKEIAERGLPALIEEAKNVGVVLDEDLIEKAGELDKAFRKVEERAATAFKKIAVDWGGDLLLDAFKGLEIAVKMAALSFDLFTSGRVREALGLITRFEAAQQRIAVGAGTQLTKDDANKFYEAVGIKPAPEVARKKTKLPSAGEDGENKKSPFDRETEQTKKRIELLNVETATIDLNQFARERARKVVELETAAKLANKQAGLDGNVVTAEQRVQIEALADAYAKAKVAATEAEAPLRAFARAARDTGAMLDEAALRGVRSLEDGLVDVVTGTESVQDAFKKMASAIIADLARIAIRKAITGPLAGLLGGDLPNYGTPAFVGPLPGRADGGPVQASKAYVVGERRPELFVPGRSGVIVPRVPNVGGGGQQITYAPSYDARGASIEAVARLEQIVARDRAEFKFKVQEIVRRRPNERW